MDKRLSYVLRTSLFLLILVAVCASVYSYSLHSITRFFAPSDGDIFLNSMSVSDLVTFPNGNTLVFGTFLQSDSVLAQNEVYIKAYDETGRLLDIGSIEIPAEYTVFSYVRDTDRIFLLCTPEGKTAGSARVYEISAEAKLLSETVLTHPDPEYANADKQYFITKTKDGLYYAVLTQEALFYFGPDQTLRCKADLLPDVTVKQIGIAGGSFIALGSINHDDTYNAYFCSYNADGSLNYSIRTMTDYTSVCTDFFRVSETEEAYYLAGYYFDVKTYVETYYKNNEALSGTGLAAIANQCIERSLPGRSVLISSDYFAEPWCSNFALKISTDGTIIASCSPLEASSTAGVSSLSILNAEAKTEDEMKNRPVITYICSLASSKTDSSYQTEIYNVSPDLSISNSAQITLSSDIYAYFSTMPDGRLVVYTAINGINQYALHIYENSAEYAAAQKKLELCRRITYEIETSVVCLPYVMIFILLAVTSRYAYVDSLVKKRARR